MRDFTTVDRYRVFAGASRWILTGGLASIMMMAGGCGGANSHGDAATGGAGPGGHSGSGGATGGSGAGGSAGAAGSDGAAGSGGTGGNGSGGRGGNMGVAGGGGTASGGSGSGGRGGSMGTGGSGSGGRGGSTGTGGSGGGGRGGSMGTGGGGLGGGGGAACGSTTCPMPGRACCNDKCVNPANDPFNCGTCGTVCEGGTPMCFNGKCQANSCSAGVSCAAGTNCCGTTCCALGALCCDVQGPVGGGAACHMPTADQPSCPQGCSPFCVSDRNQKKKVTPADTDAILEKVRQLPLSHWTYTNEPDSVRHLGPMAQDFYDSFRLGNDDRTYYSVDAHGVALASIQALERRVAEQDRRVERLERENQRLARQLAAALTQRQRRPAR